MISEEDANPLNLLYYYNYKLVEHLLRNEGVISSNLIISTTFFHLDRIVLCPKGDSLTLG